MRISPVYTPQNIVNNPPQITNHPVMEYLNSHVQEFKSNEKDLFHKTLKTEKKKDNLMTFIFVAMLGITIFSLYKAYKTLKNGLKKLK